MTAGTEEELLLPPAPYPGLRAFAKAEWPIFFGRESMTHDIVSRVVELHMVAVHGDSGCGKSSLVAAGVLPVLESDQARSGGTWQTCIMRPEDAPLGNLARALAPFCGDDFAAVRRVLNLGGKAPDALAQLLGCGAERNVCIVFDQFEELFEHARRFGTVEAELVTGFLSGLTAKRPQGLHAILTMRSDYFGHCARYRGFAETVNATQYLVPRMERPALIRAIREPALLYGGQVTPELADRLIADAGSGQDQLPLIQHGLMLLWRRKTGGVEAEGWALASEDYDGSGSLAVLLSRHADEVARPAIAIPDDRMAVAAVFRALIDQTAEGLAIRRRASFAELCAVSGASPDRLNAILLPFRAADTSFLRPYGTAPLTKTDMVDVTHESFIRSWVRIAGPGAWLERETEDALKWSSFRMAARQFEAKSSNVLSAGATEDALRFLATHNEAWAERYGGDYQKVARLIHASHEAAERIRRKEKRTRFIAVAAAVIFALLGFVLYVNWTEAKDLAARAMRAELEAKSAAAAAAEARDLAEINETISLAALSLVEHDVRANATDAVKLALAAWPRAGEDRIMTRRVLETLSASLPVLPRRLVLQHEKAVGQAIYSPDGTHLVTASQDGTARIWEAATGRQLAILKGHASTVTAASFSPDGTRVITASADGSARIWDSGTGVELMVLRGHTSTVTSALFSFDGARVVTASLDSTAYVWDAATGAKWAALKGHQGAISSAAFSPGDQHILTASEDGTARIWDSLTGRQKAILETHSGPLTAAAFSRDGRRIITASVDATARLWDGVTGAERDILQHGFSALTAAAFSPDGRYALTAAENGTAQVWDASTGEVKAVLEGHEGALTAIGFSPDGLRIVTASMDGSARIWNTATGVEEAVLRGHGSALAFAMFSPDGLQVVTASEDGTARLWFTSSGHMEAALGKPLRDVADAEFSPDGRRVAIGLWDGTAKILDAATGQEIHALGSHESGITSVAFSPDGAQAVSASTDGIARVWNAETGKLHTELAGNGEALTVAMFSPDSQRVLTAYAGGAVLLRNAGDGEPQAALEGHTDSVTSASFSSDGKRVVTASRDGTARVWDATTGKLQAILNEHAGSISSVSYSPDAAHIATASEDGTARIWDAAAGKSVAVLAGHTGTINAAMFSPDGRRVVTASWDHTARMWNASTGRLLAVLSHHSGNVSSVRYSADGTRLLTASEDGSAIVWDATSGVALTRHLLSKDIASSVVSLDLRHILSVSSDSTARIWTLPGGESGNALQIACARLGMDTSLSAIEQRYGLVNLPPICGDHPPAPADLDQLQ